MGALLKLMSRCTSCGRPIPAGLARRLIEITGGPLLCRQCAIERAKRGEMLSMRCEACNKNIEPVIVRRIITARAMGHNPPQLCRDCFIIRRRGQLVPDRRLHAPPVSLTLDVDEWVCVRCGAPLEPEEVDLLKRGKTIQCEYCGCVLSHELFK